MREQDPSDRGQGRSVAVRIIKTQDEGVRDLIIRATNSQTKVPDASLHATETIHRQIEAHFKARGWFYDRRKNYYKNTGAPTDRIISIGGLGQAVTAIGLSRPNDARARPTTLLNNPADYAEIFNPQVDLDVYLWIASTQRHIDSLLVNEAEQYLRTNLRFHVSCYLVTKLLGFRTYGPRQLRDIAASPLKTASDEVFNAVQTLERIAYGMADEDDTDWSFDRTAKSKAFAEATLQAALGKTDS